MTATTVAPRAHAPWHYWLVSVVAVLWNGFGAYDYVMSKVQGDAYFRQAGMTDVQIAFMHAYPVWMTAVWAIGVWGAVAGAILLLARSRFGLYAYAASLAAFLMSLAYAYLLSDEAKVMGQQGSIMNVVILAGCLFFVWYAWVMTKRGVLR